MTAVLEEIGDRRFGDRFPGWFLTVRHEVPHEDCTSSGRCSLVDACATGKGAEPNTELVQTFDFARLSSHAFAYFQLTYVAW